MYFSHFIDQKKVIILASKARVILGPFNMKEEGIFSKVLIEIFLPQSEIEEEWLLLLMFHACKSCLQDIYLDKINF